METNEPLETPSSVSVIEDHPVGVAVEAAVATNKRSPSDFLKSVLGRPVRVKLNSGTEYRGASCHNQTLLHPSKRSVVRVFHYAYPLQLLLLGILACLDGYMNIAMEQTEEYVDGQLKAKYGDCFIRGNNGAYCVTSF